MAEGPLLRQFLLSHIRENNLSKSLEKEIPRKWEKYGDFVLFDERTFSPEIWKGQAESFWVKISNLLKCKRIGLKNKIDNDGYRTPNVTILYGGDPWVLHRDNSIIYTWNVERSMFSAGNACERSRIAKLDCSRDVVVDLFAGIGYFTLPFLVHSKAKFVHACEWNPAAVEALKRNLKLNKVEERCRIYEGDSLLVCPKKVANRINLGLLPSSESHWKTACEALVESGGILHVHENVETKKEDISCKTCAACYQRLNPDISTYIMTNTLELVVYPSIGKMSWKHKQWLIKGIHLLHSLNSILRKMDIDITWAEIKNVTYVKSYAPHVDHLVYDVEIKIFCGPLRL